MAEMPKTLLQHAGAPLHPSALERSALLLIDYQCEYVDGGLPLPNASHALAHAKDLLALARQEGLPVFHIVHHGRPGGALFDPHGPHAAIAPEVSPVDGEAMIIKGLPNAFAKTPLLDLVAATGRSDLIISGFMTHMCLSSTVRAALDHGYRCTVVARASATRDLPDGAGGLVPADDVHRCALAELADRFAVVVPDAAMLASSRAVV